MHSIGQTKMWSRFWNTVLLFSDRHWWCITPLSWLRLDLNQTYRSIHCTRHLFVEVSRATCRSLINSSINLNDVSGLKIRCYTAAPITPWRPQSFESLATLSDAGSRGFGCSAVARPISIVGRRRPELSHGILALSLHGGFQHVSNNECHMLLHKF